MHERDRPAPSRHLRSPGPPPRSSGATARKPQVEALVRRAVIGIACSALALFAVISRDWEQVAGALSAAAAVLLTLVPLFWSLNNPRRGPGPRAVRDEE